MAPRRPHTPERLSPELFAKIYERWGIIYNAAEIGMANMEREFGSDIAVDQAPEIPPPPVASNNNVVSLDSQRQTKVGQTAGNKAMEGIAQQQDNVVEIRRVIDREAEPGFRREAA